MTLSEPDGAGWIGHWSPGIGDPSVMGWLTVVLYAVGAWQCYRIAAEQAHRFAPREVMLWRLLALGLLALGINKQLDLQTAFTEIGRMVAAHQGWYERRHEVQINFIYGVVAFAGLTAAALAVLARKSHPATISAVIGGMCLLAFIVVRAASFNHVDLFLGSDFLGLKMNWVLEMGGIGIIIAAARRRSRSG